jgi:peptidoglycan hydrolase CwlO-like protein
MGNVSIALICSVAGAVIGIAGFIRLSKKDTQDETSSFTRVETKLDYIGKDVSDIKADFRTHATKISDIEQRVARVEESAKSAHHRIDGLEREE